MFEFQGNNLVNIKHPYWTPENYIAEGLTFEWHHDVSKFLFSGNQSHFYDILVTPGTNSELLETPETNLKDKLSLQIEGKWHYEFYKRWTVGIEGLLYRSKVWDADGIWGIIQYQF